jgi:hypothetical protein
MTWIGCDYYCYDQGGEYYRGSFFRFYLNLPFEEFLILLVLKNVLY